jgi:copper chaperone NosL
MSRAARLVVALAACSLLVVMFLPLWRVQLHAPQYPEGLGLLIRTNTVTGIKPSDLGSINGLNHYIGMKPIHPDAIPELQYMRWIIAGLTVLGLAAALRGTRRAVLAWLVVFALVGAVGMVDFWRWEYDYGHNLDMDEAIIVVPGMTYQPPLLGSKQLLNFTAASWPASGTWVIGLAFLAAAGTLVTRRRRSTA